jgi:N-methylhydantoinase B
VKEGDLLYFDTWGGGGWGDPYERPVDRVAFDVEAGLVTASGAKANYGVVLKKDLTANEKATVALRAKASKRRGKTSVFNFGGTIPELKKRCKAETGLMPPKQPEFPRWVKLEKSKSAGKGKGRKAA